MLSGIIAINKEHSMTSHDVCWKVRKILNTKKIGHTGTLDPMAEGVMGVLVGNATRLSEYISMDDKEYIAKVKFGVVSDSYDIWEETRVYSAPDFSKEDLLSVLPLFTGKITQVPPIYSAIKVKGKPLYKYAREGISVEIPSREVFIKSIDLIDFDEKNYEATIKVDCSKGTYIRSLCHDIGLSLRCGAVMSGLTRNRSGILKIEDSVTLSQLEEIVRLGEIDKVLKRDDYCLSSMKSVFVKEESKHILFNGNILLPKNIEGNLEDILEGEIIKIYLKDRLIGMGVLKIEEENRCIKPSKILYRE